MYLNRMLQFQKFYSNQGVKTTQNCPATNFSSKFWNFGSHFCNKYYFHLFKSPGHDLWSTTSLIYYNRKLCTSLFYLRLLFITENVIKRGFNFAKYQHLKAYSFFSLAHNYLKVLPSFIYQKVFLWLDFLDLHIGLNKEL